MIISIVSSIYNGAQFFDRLIESIVSQNLSPEDYEVVITDNASTDDTSAIVSSYIEENPALPIRLIRLETNVGLAAVVTLVSKMPKEILLST